MRAALFLALLSAAACHDIDDPEDPFYIHGSVVSAEGVPEPDALVRVEWVDPTRGRDTGPASWSFSLERTLRTDARGEFVLEVEHRFLEARRRAVLEPAPDGARTQLLFVVSGRGDAVLPPMVRRHPTLARAEEAGSRYVIGWPANGAADALRFLDVLSDEGLLWRQKIDGDEAVLAEGAIESAPGLRVVAREVAVGGDLYTVPLLDRYARTSYALEHLSAPLDHVGAAPVPASRGARCGGAEPAPCTLTDGRLVAVPPQASDAAGWSIELEPPRLVRHVAVRGALAHLLPAELALEARDASDAAIEIGRVALRSPADEVYKARGDRGFPPDFHDELFGLRQVPAGTMVRSVSVRLLVNGQELLGWPPSVAEVSCFE